MQVAAWGPALCLQCQKAEDWCPNYFYTLLVEFALQEHKASCKRVSVDWLRKKSPINNLPCSPLAPATRISEGNEPMQLCKKEKVGLAAAEDAKEGALATALKPSWTEHWNYPCAGVQWPEEEGQRGSHILPEDTHRLLTPVCRRGQGRGMNLAPTTVPLQRVVEHTWHGVVQVNLLHKSQRFPPHHTMSRPPFRYRIVWSFF